MTKNQCRLLKIINRYDREGTMEVLLQFGDYDFGDSEVAQAKGWRTTRLVVAGLMRGLVAKGLATNDADGYGITDRGRELIARWASKEIKGR